MQSERPQSEVNEHPNLLNSKAIDRRVDELFGGNPNMYDLNPHSRKNGAIDIIYKPNYKPGVNDLHKIKEGQKARSQEAGVNGFTVAKVIDYYQEDLNKELPQGNQTYQTRTLYGRDEQGMDVVVEYNRYIDENGHQGVSYAYRSGNSSVSGVTEDQNPFTVEEQQRMAEVIGIKTG